MTLRVQPNTPIHAPIPPSRLHRATSLYTREALNPCRGAQCAPVQSRNRRQTLRTNTENRNHTQSLGASGTPPPTNNRKAATNNRNFASSNCRVLAPGRGQCVRSWILKGALAKRSRKARTQAPLSRAPRLGSSGTFLVLFWSQKSTPIGGHPLKTTRRVGTYPNTRILPRYTQLVLQLK